MVKMKIEKSTTMSAQIVVGDINVVYLSATLSTEGRSDSISQTIQNKESYISNKEEVRQKISEFQEEVYKAQDIISEGGTQA